MMHIGRGGKPVHESRQAWLCLVAGLVLLVAAEEAVPGLSIVARWLVAIFLLRFARLNRPWPGYLLISAACAAVVFVTQIGVIPMPLAGVAVTAMLSALVSSSAYLADRPVARRLPKWSASLIFPAATVSAAYIGAQLSPFGTWGNAAYSAGLDGVAGIVAASGLWGVIFLIAWVASVVNGIWEDGLRRGAPALAACLATAVAGLTYAVLISQTPSTNAATLVAGAVTLAPGTPGMFRCHGDNKCRRHNAGQRLDALFARSEDAVKQGAKVVLWSESAAQILKSDEVAFLVRARDFATRHDVYLFAGVVTVPGRYPGGLLEDKLFAVTPGGVAWEYRKSKPVPGEPIARGPGLVPVLDTPYGRIAAVICFDADFPSLVRQAGMAKADILLVSANDWPAIARTHANMAVFRAVENGVSLVRASSSGHSIFATGTGKVVARRDTNLPGGTLLVATVPTQGHGTLYRSIGDVFAWLCLGMVALAVGWGLRFRARQM
jgi:apolipoprotein N-acyltransferase